MNYAQLVSAAKINLAIHMGTADGSGWQDLVSTRSFELPACKGFMLHVDNEEIRQLYDVGQEIDVFSSADDLCEKIRFYLDNDSIRLQMVEKAYHRCVPAYSYDQRARGIAKFIENK
jgi:spore maturation protein CgeB